MDVSRKEVNVAGSTGIRLAQCPGRFLFCVFNMGRPARLSEHLGNGLRLPAVPDSHPLVARARHSWKLCAAAVTSQCESTPGLQQPLSGPRLKVSFVYRCCNPSSYGPQPALRACSALQPWRAVEEESSKIQDINVLRRLHVSREGVALLCNPAR